MVRLFSKSKELHSHTYLNYFFSETEKIGSVLIRKLRHRMTFSLFWSMITNFKKTLLNWELRIELLTGHHEIGEKLLPYDKNYL